MGKSTGDDLVGRVRGALAGVPDVREKRMFGSLGFMVRDNLCVTARPERLMCRIDPALHDEALKQEGVETVFMEGRPYPGYVFVASAAVKSDAALSRWVELCLTHNATLPTGKVKKASARSRPKAD